VRLINRAVYNLPVNGLASPMRMEHMGANIRADRDPLISDVTKASRWLRRNRRRTEKLPAEHTEYTEHGIKFLFRVFRGPKDGNPLRIFNA
jgi:hypothetical protein